MLKITYCCVSLQSDWGTQAQLEVCAVSRCVVCNGDFYFKMFLHANYSPLCPRHDHKLLTLSVECWR